MTGTVLSIADRTGAAVAAATITPTSIVAGNVAFLARGCWRSVSY